MALQALRPAPKLLFKILSWGGHYGALHAPKPPWFLSDERKEPKLAGETPVPLSVRHNGYARKISLRGSPRLKQEIFPLTRMPSRGCKESIFLGSHPRQRGLFKGGRTSTVPRVVRPPLNALWG
ncbi:hypothetical protein K370107A2_00100 [Merdimmobilis hominis]